VGIRLSRPGPGPGWAWRSAGGGSAGGRSAGGRGSAVQPRSGPRRGNR
jgi:hypothetical protein